MGAASRGGAVASGRKVSTPIIAHDATAAAANTLSEDAGVITVGPRAPCIGILAETPEQLARGRFAGRGSLVVPGVGGYGDGHAALGLDPGEHEERAAAARVEARGHAVQALQAPAQPVAVTGDGQVAAHRRVQAFV